MKTSGVIEIFEPKKEEKLFGLLKSFGIKTSSVKLEQKRFFDVYDIKLADGIRSSRLDRVLVDIGMAMSSHSHPTGFPVMKDGIYRIEMQREEIVSPTFEQVFNSFPKNHYAPVALGVDSLGEYSFVDLNTLPNLLVGGTTGSGKSVLLHSFILSLLGSDAVLYLVDPKMVEFGMYENLSSVKTIVHSAEEAGMIIEEVRDLMETRFSYLQRSGTRSVIEYNKRSDHKNRMRPIVVIVDEWADIVLQDKDIQKSLCLVAQKGRAAGISIILATQRPSCRVISGLIKANFPGRIALKVASAVDSRVILDRGGAEKITDVGTGLYLDGSLSKPKLFRAPFITNIQEEINKIKPASKKTSFWNRFLS
jgi:S-DNA-T family DNA segregation ATPase FtsK/SpoIIIE